MVFVLTGDSFFLFPFQVYHMEGEVQELKPIVVCTVHYSSFPVDNFSREEDII